MKRTNHQSAIKAFKKGLSIATVALVSLVSPAQADDLLVKLASPLSTFSVNRDFAEMGAQSEAIAGQWIRVQGPNVKMSSMQSFLASGQVLYVQPNYKIKRYENPTLNTKKIEQIKKILASRKPTPPITSPLPDNPPIPNAPTATPGADSLFSKQWGMIDIGVKNGWLINPGQEIIVAVIDTGVDYTHEDLVANMWRNTKEIPDNGIDDDGNGYVDDIVGWDFLSNDSKPYDLASTSLTDILNGKNPGHGTHCAGNVAATANNSKGISGVAPKAKIMALRFIGDEGGTTAGAVAAIKYAVDNGAKVLSNSWGSEGEDPNDAVNNKALQDMIQYAMDKDVLFVAAAANSHRDNDNDPLRAFPASYQFDNIVSVAAVDNKDKLADFSNYGATTVDLGAPGVKIFSTTVNNGYNDTLSSVLGAYWSGTSMACPHVAGAAALYWSAHPELHWSDVKKALLDSARPIADLKGKTLTGAKLSVEDLMKK